MRRSDEFANCENDVRLDGKVAIVTGATSGIGFETATSLAKRGAKVIIASRSPTKLSDARKKIINRSGNRNVVARTMDYECLKSVRNFVHGINTSEAKLDILINNVGAISLEDRLTEDNLHLMMQVNYFGAFLLTFLLFPLMKASVPSRIVNVSSISLLLGHIDIEHMNDIGKYYNIELYCNAKLADVLFTVEMHKRIQGSGVNVYSMDPGLVKSEFFKNLNNTVVKDFLNRQLFILGRHPKIVASMPVFLATDPRVERKGGKHFRDCAEFYSSWVTTETALTNRLWTESKRLVGITPEEDWERF